ncbi:MAG: site-2 protease family protein [Oscillospiraceae bacterium]
MDVYIGRILALVIAIPIHEFAHGYASYRLGDPTAKTDGRLSLNPMDHMDIFGCLLILFTGIGWAKPVRINSIYYKDRDKGIALTAFAGPLSNIIIAFFFFTILKIIGVLYLSTGFVNVNVFMFIRSVISVIVTTNISLAVFNMIPLPPLDGFKVFSLWLPNDFKYTVLQYERYAMPFLFLLVYTGVFSKPIYFISNILLNIMGFLTGFIG